MRFAFKNHDASRTLPRRYEQSSGNIIQVTMLFMDVAPKLKFNDGIRSVPG